MSDASHPTDDPVAHLDPRRWATANRHLIGKALAEFAHERLLELRPTNAGYVVTSDDGTTEYAFAADHHPLDHWQVDTSSIRRRRDDALLPLDAMAFFVEFRERLGIGDAMLPVYLEEISSTLASAAYKLTKPAATADQLTGADFQTIEAAMTEGHPCFVANNGRLGFGVTDYRAFAPETSSRVRLGWLAVRRDHAVVSVSESTTYDALLLAELGERKLGQLRARVAAAGLDPDEYALMPVHPWQWDNKIAVTFAAEIAERSILFVGHSDDDYQPQQSIRTFFNLSDPRRHYVKTSLSILNMGFMRGLSPAYMAVTPAINDWVHALVGSDALLQERGFSVLREIAAVGYRNARYEAAKATTSPYRKMLSALWRESPVGGLQPGERLATMASLLHVDRDGRSLAAALVRRSGLPPATWLRRYLDAYLIPVAHCLYAYELAFMPHGENLILVLRDDVPVRVIMKDIGEEVVVMGDRAKVPEEISRIVAPADPDEQALAVFTDVFDGILRFLGPLLDADGLLTTQAFWNTVADCVRGYQAQVPELSSQFERIDLFAADFARSCLNRLQLRDNQQLVDLSDIGGSLLFAGRLDNPIAGSDRAETVVVQVAARTT